MGEWQNLQTPIYLYDSILQRFYFEGSKTRILNVPGNALREPFSKSATLRYNLWVLVSSAIVFALIAVGKV